MSLWFIFFLNFLTFHGFPFIAFILFFVDVDEDIDHFNFEQQGSYVSVKQLKPT